MLTWEGRSLNLAISSSPFGPTIWPLSALLTNGGSYWPALKESGYIGFIVRNDFIEQFLLAGIFVEPDYLPRGRLNTPFCKFISQQHKHRRTHQISSF